MIQLNWNSIIEVQIIPWSSWVEYLVPISLWVTCNNLHLIMWYQYKRGILELTSRVRWFHAYPKEISKILIQATFASIWTWFLESIFFLSCPIKLTLHFQVYYTFTISTDTEKCLFLLGGVSAKNLQFSRK